jgi:hypothetical protein
VPEILRVAREAEPRLASLVLGLLEKLNSGKGVEA